MTRLFVILCAAVLAACATATPYQPAADQTGRYGYTERQIEANRFAIGFNGNALTERDTVESYLLFRAAELTLEKGFDYFVVAQRATDGASRLVPFGGPSRYGFYPSYAWYSPFYGWRPHYDPFWNDTTYREVTRYAATAEIVLMKGQKPAGDPQAFDARQVRDNLAGAITRPTPG
ncbi:MAG: hypothetical protein NW200_12785 [Hyphomonadaceae bacterium]|nr:hypothetical protein [Hyphomonadaceae bacterium]